MKPYIPLLAILFATAYYSNAYSQSSNDSSQNDSIDKLLQQRLDSAQNQTTYGMVECEAWAKDAYDKELNKYYKLLMKVLSPDEKEKLRVSERNWINYRDSESAFASALYGSMQGTMWGIVSVSADADVVRARALEIKDYYKTITQQ